MKTLKLLLAGTFLMVSLGVSAQKYAFKVMANKGSNQINKEGAWSGLKTGSSLYAADQIKVVEGAYIGLLHAGGKTLELREPGTYKVADLEKKVPAGKGVASKYADYLSNQMTAAEKKNQLAATGAVHRGLQAAINVFQSTNTQQVYGDRAIVRWAPLEGDDMVYKVKIYNMFDETLISEETTETFFEIDFTSSKLEGNDIILLRVVLADDEETKSEEFPIRKLRSKDQATANVKSGISELMSDIDNQSALSQYILAGFYEGNSLLMDAVTCYETAISLAPEVSTYKEAYEDFLVRNGLKK